MVAHRLSADQLRARFDPARFDFETTDEVKPVLECGEAAMRLQPRARAALEVALATRADGFHVFASGDPHLGKVDAVVALCSEACAQRPAADDWVYVFNEAQPDRPLPVRLPAGLGPVFAKALAGVVEAVLPEIPRVSHSGRYRKQHADLAESATRQEEEILAALRPRLRQLGFGVRRVKGQLEAVPLVRGRAATGSVVRLEKGKRKALEAQLPRVSELVEETNRRLVALGTQVEQRHDEINREAAREVATRLLAPLQTRFAGSTDALAHLARFRDAVVEHHEDFVEAPDPPAAVSGQSPPHGDPLLRFQVHVLVSHGGERGSPVLKEIHPSFSNLFGSIAREVEFGVLTTDFTHLRPGVLHRANGGFLVLSARAVLEQPGAWAALKKCLRTRLIRLEELDDQLGISTAQLLRPEPIPLECTVVLTGEPETFETLYGEDPDFRELFGVRADFGDSVAAGTAEIQDAVVMIAALVRREKLLPFDRGALARTLEGTLVLAEDQRRLSLEWDRVRLLLVESSHEARRDASARVRGEHVRRAEQAARWRCGLHEERVQEQLRRGVLHVDVKGEVVGQVNAIALMSLGDSIFGRPSRVTARVGPGARGVIDIERQAHLGGPVHSKAVLLLEGFLRGRFARTTPLALEATLSFEQSYGHIEGDSASVAELAALLSAIAEAPVRQALAVTCSLGQDGTAQAVGGVTAKVEAFFDACRSLDPDGTPGVIIAASNVQHLMLRDDVCEAVVHGRFQLHAVEHVDDALQLLTGLEPEALGALVATRLQAFAEAVRKTQ